MTFQPKKVIIYEWLNDKFPERSLGEKIAICRELNVDTIFRGFWYCPEGEIDSRYKGPHCPKIDSAVHYYTDSEWDDMKNIVSKIHDAISGIKIIAAAGPRISARYDSKNNQIVCNSDKNYTTGRIYTSAEVCKMIIDPTKWGINWTKEAYFQTTSKLSAGDFTNPIWYDLHLSRLKKYIDIGCDGIWHDEFFDKAIIYLYNRVGQNKKHPAVVEMYNADVNLVKDIRDYQISKGQEPLFGMWWTKCLNEQWFPDNMPLVDYFTTNVINPEILSPISPTRIESSRKSQQNIYGKDIISIHYIDWPGVISIFAQCLATEQQRKKLKEIVNICRKYGVIYAYPVHGAWMISPPRNYCQGVTIKRAYGLYPYYDSIAPEFDTYNTIKELINMDNYSTWTKLKTFIKKEMR